MELAFGARLPGHTHLQLHELNPASTLRTELPIGAPQQWFDTIPRRSPGLADPLRANLRMTASPTRIHANPSTEAPTPSDYVIYNPGAHSDLPLLNGPSPGASPPTRIRIPQHRLRQGPAHSGLQHLPLGHSPGASSADSEPPNRNDIMSAPDGFATANLGAHPYLPLLYGPSTGSCPLTRI